MGFLNEFIIILLLLVANGIFAMAEIAVFSSRKARLKKLADDGSKQAASALNLAQNPDHFLSTVQIGITLVGVLASAYGGVALSEKFAVEIAKNNSLAPYANGIAFTLVVGTITILQLIIGELIPKRIALINSERRAMSIAIPMTLLAKLAAPLVWALSAISKAVLALFGLNKEVEAPPSEEEVTHMIEQGTTAGVFHKAERAMVEGVLRLDEKNVTEIMTRRAKIVWLDVRDTDESNWRKIVASGHSQFPVYDGSRDNVLGLVTVKALWANAAAGVPNSIRNHVIPPLYVPTQSTAVQLLEQFKKTGKHFALVTDEFGSVQGLVTLIDVMEAIVGDLPEPGDRRQPEATRREDGSWLVDGAMSVEDFKKRFKITAMLPGEDDGDYETLGGFVTDRLGRIPKASDHFTWNGWKIEVMDMDRHRVDKVLVTPPAAPSLKS